MAALAIPSFQRYAKQVCDIENMEQDLLQKQLALAQAKARYEKICAAGRVRTIQQKNDKEALEAEIDKLFGEVNALKLRLRNVIEGRKR